MKLQVVTVEQQIKALVGAANKHLAHVHGAPGEVNGSWRMHLTLAMTRLSQADRLMVEVLRHTEEEGEVFVELAVDAIKSGVAESF